MNTEINANDKNFENNLLFVKTPFENKENMKVLKARWNAVFKMWLIDMQKVVNSGFYKERCMKLFEEPDKYQFPKRALSDTEYYTAKRAGRKFTKKCKTLESIEHKYCEICGRKLVPIGTSRQNGTISHSDWSNRKLHKNCFKENGKYYKPRYNSVTGEFLNN